MEGMRAQLCAEAVAASVSGQTGPPRGYSEDTGVSWTGYTIGCEKKVHFDSLGLPCTVLLQKLPVMTMRAIVAN